jgi:two-component system, OmpR family, phosphate regulon response regulator PhoB
MTKRKVVVVDDDGEFLEELKETLSLNGYSVRGFRDGNRAIEAIRRTRPDIVLLDLKMNNKTGLQVADELKRYPETADIPFIAMTGFYVKEEHIKLMDVCGIPLLIKPLKPVDIISKIEAVF